MRASTFGTDLYIYIYIIDMDIPIRPYKIEIQITTGNESAVEGLFGWKFCTFIRPNQEQLQVKNATIDPLAWIEPAALQHSIELLMLLIAT